VFIAKNAMTLQTVVLNSSVVTQIKWNAIKINSLFEGICCCQQSEVHTVRQGTLLLMFWFFNYKQGSHSRV